MNVTKKLFVLMLLASLFGCGHEQINRVGLMSFGNLEGKIIPDKVDGKVVTGESCASPGITEYYLSNAVRDALKGTEFDTLIDVELTNKTGLFLPSNCIIVKGTAFNSKSLTIAGGK